MEDGIKLIGGPLDGNSMGPWKLYPARMIFDYDCVKNPENLNLVSAEIHVEGAERLIAEYDFDDDWKAYTFAGWTIKRIPIEWPRQAGPPPGS